MRFILVLFFSLLPPLAAAGPAEILAGYADAARQAGASGSFDAARGQRFFTTTHGGDWSCASCHTANPHQGGRHEVTGKRLLPLAPAANPARFADAARVEKWFRRNCRDVLARECSAQEKGDVLAWLLSLR